MDTPLIEFKDVVKRFDKRTILNQVNMEIYEGHITTIIGKSGTGKSVLLKHIIGLLTPEEGTILFRGKPINEMRQSERDEYLGNLSYMFQNNALFDSMTVFDNVAMPLRYTTKLGEGEIEKKVMARIEQTELTEVYDRYPSELSGGMQKRVALSRALVTDPEIVLFDEPTTGQDPIRRNAILGMVAEYQKKLGFTAIMISHEIPDVFFISDRIIVLDQGKILFQGTEEELEHWQHPFVEEVIGSIEGLQEKLTGLHSKRQFKIRYQSALNRKHPDDTYVTVYMTLGDHHVMGENMGHEATMEVLNSVGLYINKHFEPFGGFSTRESTNRFVTVLPHSDMEEAEMILEVFSKDLQETGLKEIQSEAHAEVPWDRCFEFSVLAGIAIGKPGDNMLHIINDARKVKKPIARFVCETRS